MLDGFYRHRVVHRSGEKAATANELRSTCKRLEPTSVPAMAVRERGRHVRSASSGTSLNPTFSAFGGTYFQAAFVAENGSGARHRRSVHQTGDNQCSETR